MELSQLKMVKAVARTGSIARAAEQLHCVPSNITNRLKQLEGELGTSLFIRVGRGLKISPDGEIFLGYSERILALVDEAKRAVDRQAEPSGILRIGAIESCAGGRLPPLLAEFHQRFPQVTLELVTGTWSQLFEELQHHRIDGALVAVDTPQPKLDRTALYSEPLVLVASADAAPVLSPRDLQDQTLFMWPGGCPYRRALEHWLNAHDVTVTIIGYASWGTIIDCVSAGAGMTLAPEGVLDRYTLSAGLARYRFTDLQPIDIRFVWNKEIERHTARDAFAQLLQERLGK
ncbi:LysR family transcriptional regulator [Pseudomonas chlororaphis]|uniref:LysR family transcriptional regulator n=1 Tax=Pseudomonas chlororaphis TaxID=587753 RepID=UPI0007B344C6|nr:LysR family transcriptional regulator [Pseudomonas chlororaphis]AZC49586.1 Transcriptional regulator, LysR family [Pseudomonas chlororaphis subsp. piscium]AZC56167.1 Transcriptional regulator, LysR family [Pseudomonas chlororaphis subsp. piscium]AZC62427.1 Transcriptional regulator, LysR family [Pseudomonas chlororaphis subsp. piscium]AZC68664.1 Transcriptional regulator, LysR family [Pseudomonas chlororaphis subsp. piscium]AZC74853.1 Transcriptional regulator, LysR family [Pseudomonas chlo